MANEKTDLLFPVGRLIMGDCYVGSDTDSKGVKRVVKTGPNAGKPFTQFFIGVAIPKGPEQAWWQTDWGQKIMAVGAAGYPQFYQNKNFSWKIDDGDSTEVNKNGNRPCDAEGAKGHWIVKFSSTYPTKVYQQPSPGVYNELATAGLVKKGYWVQVFGNVADNRPSESPGVYLNPSMLLFVRADAEITSGPGAATAFAGAAISQALPGAPGMAAIPFAGAPTMGAPMAAPTMGAPMAAPAMAAAPTMVAPNPGFLAVPGAAPGMPAPSVAAMPMAPVMQAAPPAAPAVPAGPALTPAGVASGFTYAQYRASNWTDDQLRANGLIA